MATPRRLSICPWDRQKCADFLLHRRKMTYSDSRRKWQCLVIVPTILCGLSPLCTPGGPHRKLWLSLGCRDRPL